MAKHVDISNKEIDARLCRLERTIGIMYTHVSPERIRKYREEHKCSLIEAKQSAEEQVIAELYNEECQ